MTDRSADIDALARRVEAMEDRWQILELLSAYGPAVDSGSADVAADLWLDDGVYDVDSGMLRGRAGLRAMIEGDMHQGFIRNGSAHLMGLPHIVLDGDRAIVTGHSQLVLKVSDGPEFAVARITANRWELVKIDGRWRVERRIARLLDGRAEARALLAALGTVESGTVDDR
ncbi:nuclear transport factor 2 family protein [Nocardia farcinica]|uniref:nuclear transport factor 2 family protein n=1 Tax=Nocardia farcinica TaxID=37329 RepID=UPI0024589E69|nr:nuclear transport factor 2 family protein [Nocardia farcinica]